MTDLELILCKTAYCKTTTLYDFRFLLYNSSLYGTGFLQSYSSLSAIKFLKEYSSLHGTGFLVTISSLLAIKFLLTINCSSLDYN